MGKIAFLGIQKYPEIEEVAHKVAQCKHSVLVPLKTYKRHPNVPNFLNQNFALAQKVIEHFGARMCDIGALDLPGRMQKVRENIWIDVGHNLDSALALIEEFHNQKFILVFNAYKQKNIHSILNVFKNHVIRVEIISVDHERMIQKEKLEDELMSLGFIFTDFKGFNNDELYVVFGSFSVVSEIVSCYLEK